jgi:DNA-directed RNA polymerase specialized sigma24 family protein
MGYHESGPSVLDLRLSEPTGPDVGGDVVGLVTGAADGDETAWRQLVSRFAPLVRSIARAHRLTAQETSEVCDAVWLRLDRHLAQIHRPDRVGAWLAAVTRDECVRLLTASG